MQGEGERRKHVIGRGRAGMSETESSEEWRMREEMRERA